MSARARDETSNERRYSRKHHQHDREFDVRRKLDVVEKHAAWDEKCPAVNDAREVRYHAHVPALVEGLIPPSVA